MSHPAAVNTDPATAFFINEVDPATRAFIQDYGCVWKGRSAAILLTHTADHVWHARPADRVGTKSDDAFRSHLARDNADFQFLCDVTNASKHAVLRSRGASNLKPRLSKANQIAPDQLGWDNGIWDETRWDSPTQVYVRLDNGSVRVLDAVVKLVHAMWCVRLQSDLPPLE